MRETTFRVRIETLKKIAQNDEDNKEHPEDVYRKENS